jgi:hypothetical protein
MRDVGDFEAFGRWLRELRGDTPQKTLARQLGCSQPAVSNAEHGTIRDEGIAQAYDDHFSGTGDVPKGAIIGVWRDLEARRAGQAPQLCQHGELAELAKAGGGVVVVTPLPGVAPGLGQLVGVPGGRTLALPGGTYEGVEGVEEVEDMSLSRRHFTAGVGLAVPVITGEASRQGLLRILVGDRWASVEEWQAIVAEHFLTYYTTPPTEAFTRLSADLAALEQAFTHEHSEPGQRQLRAAGALLAQRKSEVIADLGDLPNCRRWARAARQAADASGDLHTRLWVRGREIVMGLYQQRPLSELLDLADGAVAIGREQGPPATWAWSEVLAGHAQILAVAGRKTDTETALDRVRVSVETLPDHERGDGVRLGFGEHNLRYTEGFAYAHLGDCSRAEVALDAARQLYPHPREVEMMWAICMARTGDVTAGVAHARDTISQLPPAHRVRTVVDMGQRVIDAVPVAQRDEDGVMALRELVGA